MRKERVFRNGDAQISEPVIPPNYYEDFDIPLDYKEYEKVHAGGKILPTHEWNKGYPMAKASPKTKLQIATFWYYLLGLCTTVGTDTAITGRNVTYGGAGKVITIDGAGLTINAWVGYVCVVTGGDLIGRYWYITANAANTITLEETDADLPATFNADVVKIVGPPYTHTITMANQGATIPSFSMHAELQDWSLYYDLLGCLIIELELQGKEEGDWEETPTIESPIHIAGANRAMPSPQFHTDKQMTWADHTNTFQVQYNGVNIDSVTDLRSWVDDITLSGTRKYEYKKAGGNQGMSSVIMTGFEFTCKFNYRLQGSQLLTISDLNVADYAGALTLDFKLQRTATDYIRWQIDKCTLQKIDSVKFPNKDDGELFIPVTLELAPDVTGAVVTVTAVDAYSHKYYEDASE